MLSSLALVLNCLEEMRVFFWIHFGSKLRYAVESRTDFEIATLKRCHYGCSCSTLSWSLKVSGLQALGSSCFLQKALQEDFF